MALLSALACAALPQMALAQTTESAEERETRHHLSLILGATTLVEDGETAITYGVDYEYELSERLGIGFVAERAEGAVDATTLLAVMDIHLQPGFVLQIGPGVEWAEGETFFIARTGLLYEIDIGDWVIAPTVSYDFSEGPDAVIYGVTVGVRF
ncbi:MAG: hypothetical protein AAFX04_10140 [Pseudomonadota bacterium]